MMRGDYKDKALSRLDDVIDDADDNSDLWCHGWDGLDSYRLMIKLHSHPGTHRGRKYEIWSGGGENPQEYFPSEFIDIVFHTARRRKQRKESVWVRCSWKVAETFLAQRDVHLKVVKYGAWVREGVRTRVSRIRLTLNTLNYSYYHEHQLPLTACSHFTSAPTPCLSPNPVFLKNILNLRGFLSVLL